MANNHKAVVDRINQAFPELLKWNTHSSDAEFLQRVVNEPEMKAERWGLLSKNDGENGFTFPNGIRTSHDAIALPNGERIDIISGAGAHPAPGGPSWGVIPPSDWRPHNVWIDISSWPMYNSDAPDEIITKPAILGRGWFSFLRALKDWPQEALANWDFILANENPDIFRIMLNVEGYKHQAHHAQEPWAYASVDPNASWWSDKFKECLASLGYNNKKGWFTLHGGQHYLPSDNDRLRFNDKVVEIIQSEGAWSAVFGFEVANEYEVNGFTDHQVQILGEDLSRKIPADMWLALSSPSLAHGGNNSTTNEQMLAGMERLYGPVGGSHHGANLMTIHRNRDMSCKWSDPYMYNSLMPELPKADNEPSGQGASAGGDKNDPAFIRSEYENVSGALWIFYMAHNGWCPWNGHLPKEYEHEVSPENFKPYIKDVTNQPAISATLKEFRGAEDMAHKAHPYEQDKVSQVRQLLEGDYARANRSIDGGIIDWSEQTMIDYYNGMPWDESLAKHRGEWCASLGIPVQ